MRKVPDFSGGQLFDSADVPISIIFYKNEIPKKQSNTLVYYAPKTYIKNDVLEGIVIDYSDVKYLPRTECQKPDTKIWKIAMWGSYFDFEFIEKINENYVNLKEYFKSNEIVLKTGLNSDSDHPDFIPKKIIKAKKIDRYYTVCNSEKHN